MVKGVIFDIDGVLLDSMIIWNDLGARYLRSINVEPEPGLNEILFSMSMEQGAEYLKEHYHLLRSSAKILNGISDMLKKFYYNEVLAKEGARELMSFFKEKAIPMVAATSSPRSHVERALGRNEMLGFLDKIFTTGEVGVSKHSSKIYDIAAEHLGFNPSEILVFEDSLYALKTAKEAEYFAIGVYDEGGEKNQDGMYDTADIYLEKLSEI